MPYTIIVSVLELLEILDAPNLAILDDRLDDDHEEMALENYFRGRNLGARQWNEDLEKLLGDILSL